MSKLEELIQRLCPDGVEYKKLSDLGYFYGGLNGKTKNDFVEGNAKFITYMNVYKNIQLDINIKEKVKVIDGEKQNEVKYGDILFTGSSENAQECGFSSVLTLKTEEKVYLNSFCFGFRLNNANILIPGFSKYLFRCNIIRKQIIKTASGVTRFNVSKKKMENVTIPVPPIEIQNEIVRILDNYTELTEELTEELTAELATRKQQYDYYTDELLNNVKGERTKIKSIYNRVKGTSITAGKMKEISSKNGDIKIFAGGKTVINAFEKDIPYANITNVPAVLVQSRGLIDFIYYDKKFTFKNEMWAYTHKDKIYLKYLYYVLKNNILYFRKAASGMGSMPQISLSITEDFKIQIPSIEEQERIVSILDRFEKLCNDITQGLPAEIEARKQQYEYYRNKLLTFKELKTEN